MAACSLAQIYEEMETAAALCGDFPVTITFTRVLQNNQKISKLSKLFTPHLYHPNDHPRLFKYHQDAFSRPRVRVAIFAEIAY